MLWFVGLIVFLIILVGVVGAIGSMISSLLVPVFSAIGIVIGGYSYLFISPLFGLYIEDDLKTVEITMWGIGILLVLMIFDPAHTRTTKSGKADKRFKNQIDESQLALNVGCFFTGILLLGILYLLDKFEIVNKIISMFN